MDSIVKFIEEFKRMHEKEIEDVFMNGYCYYFAIILDERYFHSGTIMYIPIYNHFCYKIYGDLYDITGLIKNEEYIKLATPWEDYQKKDYLETSRLYMDCILKAPRDIDRNM